MDSAEEAEQAEQDIKIVKEIDDVGGSRYCLSIPKIEFGLLIGKWELPIMKRHTEGQ